MWGVRVILLIIRGVSLLYSLFILHRAPALGRGVEPLARTHARSSIISPAPAQGQPGTMSHLAPGTCTSDLPLGRLQGIMAPLLRKSVVNMIVPFRALALSSRMHLGALLVFTLVVGSCRIFSLWQLPLLVRSAFLLKGAMPLTEIGEGSQMVLNAV